MLSVPRYSYFAICYQNGAASVKMRLGDDRRVSLDDRLLASLSDWLRPENVDVINA